jgi:hypothetical protein
MRSAKTFCRFIGPAFLLGACGRQPDVDPRVPPLWMHTLYGSVRAERLSPPVASRIFAYAGTALYSGFAAADPKLTSPAGKLSGLAALPRANAGDEYDAGFTALVAERVVLDSLFAEGLPTTRASLARLADSLSEARAAQGISAAVRARSEDLGHRTGLAIVAWSRTDGFDSTRGRKYVPPKGTGLWINDSPANWYATQNMSGTSEFIATDNPANAMRAGNAGDRALILSRPKRAGQSMPAANMAGVTEPYWWQLRPFVLDSWKSCGAPPPPPYSVDTASVLYKDAKLVYEMGKNLTPAQKSAALYWADNAGESGTPAGHWLSIASQMVSENHLSAEEGAQLMMLTSVSIADAFIAAWGYKFTYNSVRPRPYIRATMDSTWEPAIPNPPFPEYLSGHSTMSAAAATMLTAFVGDVAFEDSTSISIGHDVRRFPSFRAAAEEAGLSRIFGGIHFQTANVQGQALGRCVGDKVAERLHVTARR